MEPGSILLTLHIPVDNLYYILRRVGLINQAPTTFKSVCLINQTPIIGLGKSSPRFFTFRIRLEFR